MRRHSLTAAAVLALSVVPVAGCGDGAETGPGGGSSSSSSSGTGGEALDPTEFYSPPPDSCAYDCPHTTPCVEQSAHYVCPSLGPFADIPHAPECGGWDGKYPDPVAGKCTASAPTKEALKRSGVDPDDNAAHVLPDGRRVHPAGQEWIFGDLDGGLTSGAIDVPGTPFVLAVETGYGDHAVRVIDTLKLAAGQDPVVSLVKFPAPETLNSGLALGPNGRVLVSSNDGVLHALTLDPVTGALTRDDTASVPLPPSNTGKRYVSGVAFSPDGARIIASAVDDKALLVLSGVPGPTYGTLLGQVALDAVETFGAYFDPHDPSGMTAYVSFWADRKVEAIDLSNPVLPVVKATYATGKNPEGIAFLDARFFAVAAANGDELSLVDRVSGEVTEIPIDAKKGALPGQEPSAPAWDEAGKRLYVTLGGENAVAAFDVDLAKTPPTFTRAGALGTGWWPSSVVVRSGGDLVVTTLRGHGGGPIPQPFGFGDSDIGLRMHGSVQWIAAPAPAELAAGETQAAIDIDVAGKAGAPVVTCPAGAADFPVPTTNEGGSPVIDHIFFILRENKNFDAIFGDLKGVDGEPTYTLKSSSADMDAIWHNMREAARGFVVADNYYTDAVFSTQGHVWATYARSSDFNERTWAISGPRDSSPRGVPGGGVTEVGRPLEGSLFDWLLANKVKFDILGEVDGQPVLPAGAPPVLDIHYPGVGQNIGLVDLPKACYAAGRVRVACNLGSFVYQTLPNDHTLGLSPDNPSPATMCAVNDEATGMMIDAISHSPYWKSSLIIVTEDDPSSGGEHVDGHRTPLVLISPWVKRGYVTRTHIDMASLHKIYAHVLGLPYPNRQVEGAMIPYDAFTSTPDYTPFVLTPRTWPLACGAEDMAARVIGGGGAESEVASGMGAEEELTKLWDFSHEDEQPGLGAQVWRAMRGAPLKTLPADMRARVVRWRDRMAVNRKDDDDD
jgi:hypothetical protein